MRGSVGNGAKNGGDPGADMEAFGNHVHVKGNVGDNGGNCNKGNIGDGGNCNKGNIGAKGHVVGNGVGKGVGVGEDERTAAFPASSYPRELPEAPKARPPDGQVEVDMGAPIFEHSHIPFIANGLASIQEFQETLYALPLNHPATHDSLVGVLSMGNPHAVQVVGDVDSAPVLEEGPEIEKFAAFPKKVNVGYLQAINRNEIKLRVFERGAGETLACGTGACAAVVSGIRRGLLDSPVKVHTRGGDLQIAWGGMLDGVAQSVIMTGPAVTVFEGETTI